MCKGSEAQLEKTLAKVSRGDVEIEIVTYEFARLHESLQRVRWQFVFADEGHRVKNPNSKTTLAMLHVNCERRIGLTGTLMQNNLNELWQARACLCNGVYLSKLLVIGRFMGMSRLLGRAVRISADIRKADLARAEELCKRG